MPSRQQEDLWMSWNRLSSQLTSTNHQVEVTSILVECKALLRSIDGTSEEHNNAFGTKLQILFRLMLALCHRRLHHPYRSWRSATFALDHYRIASLRGMTIESEDQYIPWPSLNEIAYRLEEEMFMTYQALLESCEHTSDKDESEFWSIDSNDALHFHDALLEDERSEETFSEVGVYELRDSPDDLSEPEVTLDEASMGQGATEVVGGNCDSSTPPPDEQSDIDTDIDSASQCQQENHTLLDINIASSRASFSRSVTVHPAVEEALPKSQQH